MPCFKVKVKWGREMFKNIEINNDEEPIVFKAQLFALTGILPERQKVMCKGSVLKDDEWNMELKEGATLLLLGTKEEVPQEPVVKPTFIEDMNESELATAMDLPAGMVNLGNTCYMNAVVQCLHSVPELKESITNYKEDSVNVMAGASSLIVAMKSLFSQMEKGGTVTPIIFLQTLHMIFPQFAQQENNTYKQQDANECWSELLKIIQQKIPPKEGSMNKFNSLIEQYFGGTFEVEMKCNEAQDEPSTKSIENFLQLSCFISAEVKYMHSGLRSKLIETLTKNSITLGRDALYTKKSLISRLPAYLTVQFVRFQYKGKEGINAKVLKDIKFPINFDAYELCTPDLQKKLTEQRAKYKEVEDAKIEARAKTDDEKFKNNMADEEKKAYAPYWFDGDIGSSNSGFYTLQAVLTHKGRSSSSGHYVAWVKQKSNIWIKFDDDNVAPVQTDDILRLSGGGDWHCAYVLLYGPRLLEITENKDS